MSRLIALVVALTLLPALALADITGPINAQVVSLFDTTNIGAG